MEKLSLFEQALLVETKEDFKSIINQLKQNYIDDPQKWSNTTIDEYLEGVLGTTGGVKGYYKNNKIDGNPDLPSWKMFALILVGATHHS